LSEIEIGKAMSSRSRLEILDLLSRRPMSVEELSRQVSLKTITIRHHINMLKRIGLVVEHGEERRKIGRPVVRYRATQKPMSVQYPKRRYELLSGTLVQALLETLGRDRARDALKKIGRSMGENLAREITKQKRVTHWDMEALKKHIVQEHLSEVGAVPEIVSHDSKKIQFRMYNCVFLELAEKFPDLICESLDDGLMEALLKGTVGKAHANQTKCVVHNDEFCEYIIRLGK
jgi:predicted ArsR family transcriptional regulator